MKTFGKCHPTTLKTLWSLLTYWQWKCQEKNHYFSAWRGLIGNEASELSKSWRLLKPSWCKQKREILWQCETKKKIFLENTLCICNAYVLTCCSIWMITTLCGQPFCWNLNISMVLLPTTIGIFCIWHTIIILDLQATQSFG